MGTSAVFGTAEFGSAVFGSSGGSSSLCLTGVYTSLSTAHDAVELTTDTKFLQLLSFSEPGTNLEKLVLIKKA